MATAPQFSAAFSDRPTRWGAWGAGDRAWLGRLDELYAARVPTLDGDLPAARDGGATAAPQHVPHVIHHIWLGSPLPSHLAALVETWRALHPTWRHIMWDDAAAAAFDLRNRAAFDAAANYGEKSDVLRYEILSQMGGVYVDIDMECVRALDALADRYAFVAGLSNSGTVELNNAIIMSAPHHPIVEGCIAAVEANCAAPRRTAPSLLPFAAAREAKRQRAEQLAASLGAFAGPAALAALRTAHSAPPPPPTDPIWTIARTGPGMLTRVVRAALDAEGEGEGAAEARAGGGSAAMNAMALPPTFFYPIPNTARAEVRLGERAFCTPHTFCIHYWLQTWQSPTETGGEEESGDGDK